MRRKFFGLMLCALLLALSFRLEAQQQPKLHRVGVLWNTTSSSSAARMGAFRQGLKDLGYVEGQNIVIEERSSEGQPGRQAALAAELVHRNVAVIVTAGTASTQAASKASNTIPIVMTFVSDPVGSGFIDTLARPGGNITGFTNFTPELSGKWLELLKDISRKISKVAVLFDPTSPIKNIAFKEMHIPATALGIQILSLEIRDPNELEHAFETLKNRRPDAFIVLAAPSTLVRQQRILDLAAKNRLPVMYQWREYVDAGGLAFYGPSVTDMYRRAATYVDKILKGRKPADLPVEQPKKFDFVVNLKAAKQIGLTISPNVLSQADKVIK